METNEKEKTLSAIDKVINSNKLSPIQVEQLKRKKEILLKDKDVKK